MASWRSSFSSLLGPFAGACGEYEAVVGQCGGGGTIFFNGAAETCEGVFAGGDLVDSDGECVTGVVIEPRNDFAGCVGVDCPVDEV